MAIGVIPMKNSDFQGLIQSFFLGRLINQQKASDCTVQSYKDTFRILLKYLNDECNTKPDSITMAIMNADTIVGFLNYLETHRGNKCKTVNNRLAAIKSFMEYVSYEAPEYSSIAQKVKRIPFRRAGKKEICSLTRKEIDALLNACEQSTLDGNRDYLMILLLYNSGMRVSEMISIRRKDIISFSNGQCRLRIMGKGRKERIIPLWKTTSNCLMQYTLDHKIQNDDYLLHGRNIDHLTRSGVRYRIDCIVKRATSYCPSLKYKSISPHMFRHSTAMSLLQSGVDISTIAIWLGHESIETTHKYMVSDINLKENALQKLSEPNQSRANGRYHATGDVLEFLNKL